MGDVAMNEALAFLDGLMTEFFAPSTNNARKREIENILDTFSGQADSWRHCLYFLGHSKNQYVSMFTLTSLENFINRKWMRFSAAEKSEMRMTLWNHLIENHFQLPAFIRNKLAKLIVDIARYDWPHFYPDFFTNILELINRGGHAAVLGLILAAAASEELGGGREISNVTTDRAGQLQRHLLKGMPQLLQAISFILEKYSKKGCDKIQQNPPPSPTSGNSVDCSSQLPSLLPDLLNSSQDTTPMSSETVNETIMLCLTTLQHLFSWLPLSSHVPPSLVTTVFYWASAATQIEYGFDISMAGMGTINELLYRRYAPPSSAATALRLHHCALRLLRHLAAPQQMHNTSEDYLDKLAEFLRLFVSLHFKRLEAEPEFDAVEFLSYLFQYTFHVPTCSVFMSCLDIWLQFIEALKPEDSTKYSEALVGLVNGVLNKIQFQHNKVQLQNLDNETVNDDGETEWQIFVRHCVECVARVADLAPLHIFTIVLERWQCLLGVHTRLLSRSSTGPMTGGPEGERLLAALLDLASLTRVLGRLAPTLVQEDGWEQAACALLTRLGNALSTASVVRLHRTTPQPTSGALVAVNSEMFACMGAWVCYASSCGLPSHVMNDLFQCVTPYLMPCDDPSVLCHAAAHLLLSLSKSVKLTSMNGTTASYNVRELCLQAQRTLSHLEPKTGNVVRQALCALLLAEPSEQNSSTLQELMSAWSGALLAGDVSRACSECLPVLSRLVSCFGDYPTLAKKALANSIQGAVQAAINLLLVDAKATKPVMSLLLALFTALQQQLGAEFTNGTVNMLLQIAKRDQACWAVSPECDALEQLLVVLRLGVEGGDVGPGGASRGSEALASIMHLAIEQALPAAVTPDAQVALYSLLGSILLHRWKYFFPAGVRGSPEPANNTERTDQLRIILTVMGRALLQSDIHVFRLNLETLEKLNARWKLYHKAIFCTEFLSQFLTVMLHALVEKRHALLRDELVAAVYALAAVDFHAFHTDFIPQFLATFPDLNHQQMESLLNFTHDTDLPTFSQNISKLVNDIQCYRMCNSCLQSGSADVRTS